MKKVCLIVLCLSLLLCACGTPGENGAQTEKTNTGSSGTDSQGTNVQQGEPAAIGDLDVESLFSDRDYEVGYDPDDCALITLSGSSAQCDSNAVTVNGGTVTITDEGTYVLRGSLEGMVIVNAEKEDKVQLVLDGVDITSPTSSAIYVLQADKVFLTVQGENSLENGGTFEAIDDNNIDAAIFSKEDLTMNGEGSLSITSPAGHGVVSKDELTITSGTYTVACAGHGLDGKDSVAIANAAFTITAGKDGIHAENDEDAAMGYAYIASGSFTITAEGDGISAGSCMQIDGGSFNILCGGGAVNAKKQSSDNWGGMGGGRGGMGGPGGGGMGGGKGGGMESMEGDSSEDSTSIKGIKAGGELVINDGSFTIDAADDAIHSNANVTVCGGTFQIATGDDGFHADEALVIQTGTITVTESYEGLEGLSIAVCGGDITLKASDDGLNAAGGTDQSGFGGHRGGDQFGGMGGGSSDSFITISGGTLYINASGDGIDSNGTLEISDGSVTVCGPTQGDTAVLDYDTTGTITGGTFIGTGSYMMAQTFSSNDQGVIALSVGSQSAGTRITLSDDKGDLLVDYTPELDYAILIISTPEMKTGDSYTVTVGELSDSFEAY